jgi:hypothetical protein
MNFCRRLREGFKDIVVPHEKGSERQRNKGSKGKKESRKGAKSQSFLFYITLRLCDFARLKKLRAFVAKKKLSESRCKTFVYLCGKLLYDRIKNPILQRDIH